MKVLDLRLTIGLNRIGLAGEGPGQAFHRLLLPSVDHRLMDAVLGDELRHRHLTSDRPSATFAGKSAEYRFRFPVIRSVLSLGKPGLSNCPGNRDHLTLRK
mgnify:CR=1 FL=1|jgi:hypothetical protein